MIKEMNKVNLAEISALAHKLWPESKYEILYNSFQDVLVNEDEMCFLYYELDQPIGFVHVSTRYDYVEGSQSSPVGYIEGIYVDDQYRRKGYSARLSEAAQNWAKSRGYSEIASDCELVNEESIAFHKGIGFEEANRIVCFIKTL